MADGRLKQEYLDSMGTALLINGLQLCKEIHGKSEATATKGHSNIIKV